MIPRARLAAATPCVAVLLAACPLAQVSAGDLVGNDTTHQDWFGYGVDHDGGTAAVGAIFDDEAAEDSGAAFAFELGATGWVQTGKLVPSDAVSGDQVGTHLAVGEGVVVVGGRRHDGVCPSDDKCDSGAAWVFDRTLSGWVESQKLEPADLGGGDLFGNGMDLVGDLLAIGAHGHDALGANSGAVYLFERGPGGWTQSAKLVASDGAANHAFGASVSISSSGDRILIGARMANDVKGAAYVFERAVPASAGWVQKAKITALDSAWGDEFGSEVAVDGDTAVIAAWVAGSGSTSSGVAYVFEPSGSSWGQTAKLLPSMPFASGAFGWSMSLSGNRLAIGARGEDSGGFDSGGTYVYRDIGSGWMEEARIDNPTPGDGDNFGASVSLTASSLLVGAYGDKGAGFNAGRAWLFSFPTFVADTETLSIASGGTQTLTLSPGPSLGGLPYLVMGSLSGTAPGIPVGGGEVLPLNVDAYTIHTATSPNSFPLTGSFGTLDALGTGTASFFVGPAHMGLFAGLSVHHAAVVIELVPGLLHLPHISNPVPLSFVP